MIISAIQSSGIYRTQEAKKAQTPSAAPTEEVPAREKRIVPEERVFDRYEPEAKEEVTTCNTDKVDQEIEQLKKRRAQLEEQVRTAAPEAAEAVRQ